jgi:hypothetical protein
VGGLRRTASSCVFLMRGQYDEAVADARRAVKLAPGSVDVADPAGFVLAPSGYPEEAAAQTEKAMALNSNYAAVCRCIWAISATPIACRGEPSKRLPPLKPLMPEAPDLALPIL